VSREALRALWSLAGEGAQPDRALRLLHEQRAAGQSTEEERRDRVIRLEIVPTTLAEANAFVVEHHRHHPPVVGAKFCLAVAADHDDHLMCGGLVVGVAIVGRPNARHLDDGWTLEVTRVATNGTKNAASALYGACRRAAFALGYHRLVTYTLASEPGTSLRAAGWSVIGEVRGRSWSCPSRPRIDRHPLQNKLRWETVA
jgi:hypothetical protein